MRGFMSGTGLPDSQRFDGWLGEVVERPRAARDEALIGWKRAPSALASHPREEHLIPLHVAAGAAGDDVGRVVFRDRALNAVVAAVRFG
jgi:aromatic ring-opening dioxygenase catalytic subunit (LigB family)